MKVYMKDNNGDQASRINGKVKGLFFRANNVDGKPSSTSSSNALAILSRPSGWSGSYTCIIGFNHHRLKWPKGDELPRNGPSCLREIFFFQEGKRMIADFPLLLAAEVSNWRIQHWHLQVVHCYSLFLSVACVRTAQLVQRSCRLRPRSEIPFFSVDFSNVNCSWCGLQ